MIAGFIFTVLFCSVFTQFSEFSDAYDGIADEVVRIHILADSDDDADQTVKLKVRDSVLEKMNVLITEIGLKKSDISGLLPIFKECADSTLEKNGFDDKAECEYVNMWFDAREYDGFTMPAGYYDAVRIKIGSAKGKNWWCVMYPPLCIPAAECEPDEVFTVSETDIMENPQKYEICFKSVELYEKFLKYIEENNGTSTPA